MTESATSELQWRPMEVSDLASITTVADMVHTDFHEDSAIFNERLALYPAGCFVLAGVGGGLLGYAITHPWQLYALPALNSLLGQLPETPTTYYLHDIALLPQSRGSGAAGKLVAILVDHASKSGFRTLSLVAVNGSSGFWEKQGFRIKNRPELDAKLKSYSDDACFMVRELI